jgi:hypothetical protein
MSDDEYEKLLQDTMEQLDKMREELVGVLANGDADSDYLPIVAATTEQLYKAKGIIGDSLEIIKGTEDEG